MAGGQVAFDCDSFGKSIVPVPQFNLQTLSTLLSVPNH